ESLDLVTIDVEPLSDQESRQLATTLLNEADPGLVDQAAAVACESAGNPFFLRELVRHVATSGAASAGGDIQTAFALDEILFKRASSLPGDARRLLEVVAVAGRLLLQSEAFEAAELTADRAGALALLRSEHLLRSTGSADLLLLE